MKILKWLLISIGSLIGLLLILAGIFYFLASRPPAIKSEMRPVEVSAEATHSLEQKVKSFQQEVEGAARAGEKKPVKLEITEGELTSKLNQFIQEQTSKEELPIEVKNIQVNVKNGELLLAGEANISGVKFQGGAKAAMRTEDGKIKLEVSKVDLGRLPLPGKVKKKVMSLIPEGGTTLKLEDLPIGLEKGLPVDLKNVRLEDGKLIIEGVTK